MKINKKRKVLILAAALFIALGVLCTFVINAIVIKSTSGYIITSEQAHDIDADCILILGCLVWNEGRPSHMLEDRLLTGINLYNSKAAPKLLMSGDHGTREYDEVNAMKAFAVNNGVPADDVFMDHAGFSTYDSMYRARDVFTVKKVIIVTQSFHIYRAVYLARALGLEAYGVASDLRSYASEDRNRFREFFARVKDFATSIIKPKPKYLGDIIPITGSGSLTDDK